MAYVASSSGLLTFLDTNVVQNLHTFGEFIYRGNFSPQDEEKLSNPRIREDIFALRHLATMGRRFGWPLAVSLTTMVEFGAIMDPDKRRSRVSWWGELAEYFDGHYKECPSPDSGSSYSEITHFTFMQRNQLYEYLNVLPDGNRSCFGRGRVGVGLQCVPDDGLQNHLEASGSGSQARYPCDAAG